LSLAPCQPLMPSLITSVKLIRSRSCLASRDKRLAHSSFTNRYTSACFFSRPQSNQLVSLS
jgi:hypothetical protein